MRRESVGKDEYKRSRSWNDNSMICFASAVIERVSRRTLGPKAKRPEEDGMAHSYKITGTLEVS